MKDKIDNKTYLDHKLSIEFGRYSILVYHYQFLSQLDFA